MASRSEQRTERKTRGAGAGAGKTARARTAGLIGRKTAQAGGAGRAGRKAARPKRGTRREAVRPAMSSEPAPPGIQATGGRSGGKVDAPGKKHRKAPEATPGIPHSDQVIAKLATADRMRQARRG